MKDAKGHGSNPRGAGALAGSSTATDTRNEFEKALDAARSDTAGAGVYSSRVYMPPVSDSNAAAALSQGVPAPKSGPAPTHSAMSRSLTDAQAVHGAVVKATVTPGTRVRTADGLPGTITKVNRDGSVRVRGDDGIEGTAMARGLRKL